MSRSPLFGSLRRAFRLAALSSRGGGRTPPIDELIDMAYSRRRFLRQTAAVGAGVAATSLAGCARGEGPSGPAGSTSPGSPPRVAIVGGGMAGLNTAYKLSKAGLTATIYEGADRTGGRMFTATDLLGDRLTTELGGEFIDSTHDEMLALMAEFDLERLDTQGAGSENLRAETYFIDRRHYTHAEAARAFVPLAEKILADYDELDDVVDYRNAGGGVELDRMSIAAYLDRIGARGWMRELLEAAYVTEYGMDAGDQSALNFVFLIGTGDLEDATAMSLLGDSDERYKVRGGNQRIVDALATRVESQIRRRHRLEAIRSRGEGFTLTFQTDGGVIDQDADIVVLAIPFTLLREVRIDVNLPDVKRHVIQELGYGANAKVLVGFNSRPWEAQGYSGATYSDETFQLAWANSYLQPGSAGGLTLYSGGTPAIEAGQGTPEEAATRLLAGIERAYPGALRAHNGKVSRFHWPTFPWTKASYACYKAGQWTTLAGSESVPVGNLFFAGEHCSYDFQGFMNGAAQSGADTAVAVLAQISGSRLPAAARRYSRRQLARLA